MPTPRDVEPIVALVWLTIACGCGRVAFEPQSVDASQLNARSVDEIVLP